MSFVVEYDKAADPVEVGLFCAVGVVFGADGVADLFEQFLFFGRRGRLLILHVDQSFFRVYNLLIVF